MENSSWMLIQWLKCGLEEELEAFQAHIQVPSNLHLISPWLLFMGWPVYVCQQPPTNQERHLLTGLSTATLRVRLSKLKTVSYSGHVLSRNSSTHQHHGWTGFEIHNRVVITTGILADPLLKKTKELPISHLTNIYWRSWWNNIEFQLFGFSQCF